MTRLLPLLALMSSAAAVARGGDEDLVWVVVHSDRGASMHGDMRDLKAARKYLSDHGPAYFWFRRDGKEYVVRDGKIIGGYPGRRANALIEFHSPLPTIEENPSLVTASR